MTLADLHTGESGIITRLDESVIKFKLMDMGCLPGELVKLKFKAPFGDPLCIGIAGYELILRKREAALIHLAESNNA
jgi:ferrous iron transport protein A